MIWPAIIIWLHILQVHSTPSVTPRTSQGPHVSGLCTCCSFCQECFPPQVSTWQTAPLPSGVSPNVSSQWAFPVQPTFNVSFPLLPTKFPIPRSHVHFPLEHLFLLTFRYYICLVYCPSLPTECKLHEIKTINVLFAVRPPVPGTVPDLSRCSVSFG